ncbi:MAG: DUF559 domain-containing protein [bacterium]|nr:DUF559 domain-containing protein [bacterium]
MKIHYNPKLTSFSRELRKSGTLAEVLLWQELKGKKLHGHRFLRQKPIEKYVVDFYCPILRLAIEIDGVSHDAKIDKDFVRQKILEDLGISFLRFTEGEVRNNLDGVMQAIVEKIIPLTVEDDGTPLVRAETPSVR